MADNVVLNTGTGGATLSTDDIAGVHVQRVKIQTGADGAATDVSAANPVPVSDNSGSLTVDGPVTNSELRATPVPVSGTVTANAGTGTLATDPTDRAGRDLGKVDVALLDQYTPEDMDSGAGTVNALPVVLKVSAAGGAALGVAATPMRVDPTGTTTQPVSAASLPLPTGASTAAKQPALGTAGAPSADVITIQGVTSMTAVKVDGSGVTQPVSGTVTANAGTGTLAVSGPLTDTQLRATPVPVSGTVTANAGTGPWPVTDNSGSLTTDSAQLPAALVGGRLDVVVGAALPAGTAAIGKLAANSGVDIGDVDVTSLPALPTGTNSIGTVVDGGAAKTLKRAVVNTSTSGADVVAAVASKRIKVYSYAIQGTGTVTAYLRDGAAGAAMTLTWTLQAREGVAVGAVNPPAFLFGTTAGNALQIVLSAAVTVGVEISYWDDDAS